jgi:hypothetical protein
MTPKEKAKELVDTFKPNVYIGACEDDDELMELYHSKQCALIAVDEMIEEIKLLLFINYTLLNDRLTYWQQVKQEIEKL